MRVVKVIILAAFCIGMLTGNSLAWEVNRQEIKVFSATANSQDGIEVATNSVNNQIAAFLQKEKADIISTNMFTSATGGETNWWRIFITVSITYYSRQ